MLAGGSRRRERAASDALAIAASDALALAASSPVDEPTATCDAAGVPQLGVGADYGAALRRRTDCHVWSRDNRSTDEESDMTEQPSPESQTTGSRVASGERARLLIADDDRLVAATLVAQLGDEFELVGTASDATEAAELATHTHPDVALLDVQMPAGGGLHATRRIRELSPGTAIVILSVDESDQSVREFLTAGAVTYLRKGADRSTIVTRLHRSIAAHAASPA